jgi:hypothetical protein
MLSPGACGLFLLLSKELGIAEQVIYRWNKKSKVENGSEAEKVSDQ